MSDETPISLGQRSTSNAMKKSAPWALAGLALGAYLVNPTVTVLVAGLAVAAAAVALVGPLIRRHPWIYLSASGMRGRNESGGETRIAWTEQLSIRKSRKSNARWEMVNLASQQGEIFIPAALLEEPSFKEEIARLAPQGHVLRQGDVKWHNPA